MRVSRMSGWLSMACVALVGVALVARSAMAQEDEDVLSAAKKHHHASFHLTGPVTVTETTPCPSNETCFNFTGTLSDEKSTVTLNGNGVNALCSTHKGKMCCTTTGSETLTLGGDSIGGGFVGKSCQKNPTANEILNAHWTATGGTGKYTGAKGGGSEKLSDDQKTGAGTATISGAVHN